jgi:acyl-CoA thioesterase
MDAAQAQAEAIAKTLYSRDTAVVALGMTVLQIRPGFARIRMIVRSDMLNSQAICHGGLVFTLADTAFAYACNTQGKVTVAAAASIDFLLPSRAGDELCAEALECSRSKRSGVYDVSVRNQRGELVALFRGRSHQLNDSILGPASA